MIHDCVLIPVPGGIQVRRRVVADTERDDLVFAALRRMAEGDRSVMPLLGVQLYARWTPGDVALLSLYRATDGAPVSLTIFGRTDAIATPDLIRSLAKANPLYDWASSPGIVDAIPDRPVAITAVFPVMDAELQGRAGALIRMWALAWSIDELEQS